MMSNNQNAYGILLDTKEKVERKSFQIHSSEIAPSYIVFFWFAGRILNKKPKFRVIVSIFALKEVRVSPCSFQKNLIFRRFVDQNPVRFNVAVASPDPIPPELVVAILWRQCFLCKEVVDNSFYFSEVFASLLHAFDILLKLLCLSEIHSSHEA